MSEHQCVAFRAIDGPVSAENLKYMRSQSSRADVTPWSFDNTYNYGDFGGNAPEMLRRGYDLHLHYADFGIRRLMIRFPDGLPNARLAKEFFDDESCGYAPDKTGPGGILCIAPYHEAGQLQPISNFDDWLGRLIPLRAEIMDGDLRPLYLGNLASAVHGEDDPDTTIEAPVPAGLAELTDAQRALAGLFDLNSAWLTAAAQASPPLPPDRAAINHHAAWLKAQSAADKDAWLAALMSDSSSAVRAEVLSRFRRQHKQTPWPTVRAGRSIAQLRSLAKGIAQQADAKKSEQAARQKARHFAKLLADPALVERETAQLAQEQSQAAYASVGKLLAELREATAGTEKAGLAELYAQRLKVSYPSRRGLISALRSAGFLARAKKGASR
ncbi:MAG: hypothetical protein AB7O62_04020 [Pirellulales bacterium]